MTTSMYCLYVGVDYTYIDVNALAQGIKSFLASHVWFQAVAGARTYGTDSPAITSQHAQHILLWLNCIRHVVEDRYNQEKTHCHHTMGYLDHAVNSSLIYDVYGIPQKFFYFSWLGFCCCWWWCYYLLFLKLIN